MGSVANLTQNVRGQTHNPECGFSGSSRPGIYSNLKFITIATKNMNNESKAIASLNQTLDPI